MVVSAKLSDGSWFACLDYRRSNATKVETRSSAKRDDAQLLLDRVPYFTDYERCWKLWLTGMPTAVQRAMNRACERLVEKRHAIEGTSSNTHGEDASSKSAEVVNDPVLTVEATVPVQVNIQPVGQGMLMLP
ncbi:hypothetical protein FGB62_35g04 [Gracilaria domingensis]|nr:hypothetical protein FGB62_35g04 [Gracilaria domingensis]